MSSKATLLHYALHVLHFHLLYSRKSIGEVASEFHFDSLRKSVQRLRHSAVEHVKEHRGQEEQVTMNTPSACDDRLEIICVGGKGVV
jgi:hypothetical protein